MSGRNPFWIILTVGFLTTMTATASDMPEINAETYELDNGLNVILYQDRSNPTVAVNLWYHVGSKNEKPGRTGFAHLFEHLMFNGSEHYPSDYFTPLQKIGATINGSTSEDRTNYFEIVPSNYLELALWMESDRMGYLLPGVTQDVFDNQRDVVKNERHQRLDNQPYAKGYEIGLEMLYPPDHPYHHSVIGSMDDLAASSLGDVHEFFKLFYAPNNASIAIVGDFEMDEAKALVEKYFGYIPPSHPIEKMVPVVPVLEKEYRSVVEDAVSLAQIDIQWPTPGLFQPGDAEFDIIAFLLDTGKNSRLYKALMYDRQIAQEVNAYQSSQHLNSNFGITVTGKPGVTAEELETVVDEVIDELLANGVTDEEVNLARTNIQAGYVRSLQDNNRRANQFNSYLFHLGDANKTQWDYDRYTNLTTESVNEYLHKYIVPNRAVMVIVPEGTLGDAGESIEKNVQEMEPIATVLPEAADKYASLTLPESTVDRENLPEGVEIATFAPPAIQESKLKNGAKVYLVEDHRLPLIQTNLVILSGWSADPVDKPGTAALTSALLDEGTKTKSTLEISEAIQTIAAQFSSASSFDASSISLNVLKAKYADGLSLMADVVLNPTFPQEELDRIKKEYLGRIESEKRRPMIYALKSMQQMLMGEDNPYGQPFTGSGTETSINTLSRDDLVAFHDAYYKPSNAAFVIVGDITMKDAVKQLNKSFKKWKKGKVETPEVPTPTAPESTVIYIVDKPGAPQSAIAIGNIAHPANVPFEDAGEVMINALGGKFTSRINLNLREDKGYTYGARSLLWSFRNAGAFLSYSEVQSEVTADALSEFFKEFNDALGGRPFTEEELADSRNNIIKGFPKGFTNVRATARSIQGLLADGKSLDTWQTYMDDIEGVDHSSAMDAAKEYVKPNNMVVVIVGDREMIEPGLKELGIGEVKVIE